MSSYEFQWSMWPAQRAQRADLNDVLSTPRPVEHFAVFGRRSRAVSAADELSAAGFTVGLGRRGLRTILQATRDETLSDEDVSRFLREVIAVVERHGGDYDGWGAVVEAPPA